MVQNSESFQVRLPSSAATSARMAIEVLAVSTGVAAMPVLIPLLVAELVLERPTRLVLETLEVPYTGWD